MEGKENILDKFQIKSYNNNLEKILEKKDYSLDTKSLLLSMLYKIENGYKDYSITKVEEKTKFDFIIYIFNIIANQCNNIVVAEFNAKASETLKSKNVKYIIDKDLGKITCYGNEILLLKCILKMGEKDIYFLEEEKAIKNSLTNLLNLGHEMDIIEVVRDFNGWSWNIDTKEISNIEINLIYQSLKILLGYEFIEKWLNNSENNNEKNISYINLLKEKLEEKYGKENVDKFIKLLIILSINLSIKDSIEEKEIWEDRIKEDKEELNRLNNKTLYVKEKTEEKKKYFKKIEEIDKILNNTILLKEEYNKRNEKLANKDKIFSISHLADILEKERTSYISKINECNNLISPKGFVDRKTKIEETIKFLDNISIDNEKNNNNKNNNNKEDINKEEIKKEDINKIEEQLIDFCITFLNFQYIAVLNCNTKIDVLKNIYRLRYYLFLVVNENGKRINEISQLKEIIEKNKDLLITKAKETFLIDEITKDEEINNTILKYIFKLQMIDLTHIVVQTKVEGGKLYIEYYDEDVLEDRIEIKSDRTIKLKKKTKLFK